MANIIPGDASAVADIKPWSPDWSFLSQVYGVTQARYDKGFNQIKNLYNSVLNSPLTNSQNQQFRQQMFEKIQGSLRNTAALDLSNPTNVMRAQSLLDPITDDKELAYDMYVTKHHDGQKQIMTGVMNNTDAKIRAQYSDYSKLDIMFAEDDLRKAKRGDGSIMAVQPRDFTPFEDINEYLTGAAKDAKLQVKFARPDGKGYIMTYTNGKYAEVPFSNWAAMTMGNRFDRQFGVIGRVTAENQIRDLMSQGYSRQDATNQVAQKLSPEYVKSQKEDLGDTSSSLQDVELQIQTMQKLYPNGIPSGRQDLLEKYDKLLQTRYELNSSKTQYESEIKKVEEDPQNYTSSNLYSILSAQAKKNAAGIWGISTAQATAEVDVKPDQKVIADFDRAAANARHQASLNQAERHFQQNQQMELFKIKNANEIEIMKLKAEGKLPSEAYVGDYVGAGGTTGVDVLRSANTKNKTELFNNAFGAQTGLMNMVLGKNEDHGKYYSVLSKLQGISQGSKQTLTSAELGLIKEYGRKVKYDKELTGLDTPAGADALIQTLAANTYRRATEVMQYYTDNGKSREGRKYAEAFSATITSMKGIMQEQEKIDQSNKEIAKEIYDFRSGKIKPTYEGAKIISKLPDGTPIFDLSGLSEAKRNHVSTLVGSEFNNRKNPVGSIYSMTKPSSDELFQFFNKGDKNIVITKSNGEKIDPGVIGNLPYASQVKLFGESFLASYDGSGKNIYVDLKVDPSSDVAKSMKLKAGETIRVQLPYSYVQNTPALGRLKRFIGNNSIVSDSYGLMESFSRDPGAVVEAPISMTATGFDWTASGSRNTQGQYGVNIDFKMLNPEKGKRQSLSRFYPLDPNDPGSFLQISELINSTWTDYQNMSGIWEAQFDEQELMAYPED